VCRIAELSKRDLLGLLTIEGIPIGYDEKKLKKDLKVAKRSAVRARE